MSTDYGTDLAIAFTSNGVDMDPAGREVSGRTNLSYALVRRLVTPRGRLLDDPNYGFYVPGYLNDDLDTTGLAQIRAGVEAECAKDERVTSATVQPSFLNGVLTLTILVNDASGPFSLVLAVTSVTVTILTIGSQ